MNGSFVEIAFSESEFNDQYFDAQKFKARVEVLITSVNSTFSKEAQLNNDEHSEPLLPVWNGTLVLDIAKPTD